MRKQLKDGRTVEMVVSEDAVHVTIMVAGAATTMVPAAIGRTGRTDYPRCISNYALTMGEADALRAEIDAAKASYGASPMGQAWAARRAINATLTRAERLEDEDYGAALSLRSKAAAALTVWQAQYPEAAREERKRDLRDHAAHLRDLAAGALLYDMDGSLTAEDQQARHDKLMAEAAAKDAEAEAL